VIGLNVNWEELLGESRAIAGRFRELPAHIGKKHLLAAMRKSIRDAKGPQLLRKNTPPLNTKRGRKAKGAKRSTGALRKSVMVKAKWIGRNRDGAAFAGLGYKYGPESQKAIWHALRRFGSAPRSRPPPSARRTRSWSPRASRPPM